MLESIAFQIAFEFVFFKCSVFSVRSLDDKFLTASGSASRFFLLSNHFTLGGTQAGSVSRTVTVRTGKADARHELSFSSKSSAAVSEQVV